MAFVKSSREGAADFRPAGGSQALGELKLKLGIHVQRRPAKGLPPKYGHHLRENVLGLGQIRMAFLEEVPGLVQIRIAFPEAA